MTRSPAIARRFDDSLRGTPVEVVAPEGVPLVFRVAPVGDRAFALLLDLGALLAVAVAFALVVSLAATGGAGAWAALVGMLGLFALRYGYFTAFELRSRGATPGKRRLGVRVVDAAGGPLRADAVIVRNLLREVELFLPMTVLLVPRAVSESAPGTVQVLAVVWALAFLAVPFTNRRRLRVGDLLAGTMVVVVPRATLLADVGQAAAAPAAPPAGAPPPARAEAVAFTDAQLDVYGVYELQVLEDVLRRPLAGRERDEAHAEVASRIAKKIGWGRPVARGEATDFLHAYYAGLRARLERRMLLGKRKADKHDR